MSIYSEIQKKIVDLIESKKRNISLYGRKYNKFYGDIVCRIFMEFISKEIPQKYKIVGPNAYILGFPTEFDLMIIEKDGEPEKYTNAFEPTIVKCVIETKARGIFGGRIDLNKTVEKIKKNFESVNENYSHINFFYLTYEECAYPKKESSIKYLNETKIILNPYEVFCLKDSRSGKLIYGEWERLVLFLNKCL